jgi:hypothetical protein
MKPCSAIKTYVNVRKRKVLCTIRKVGVHPFVISTKVGFVLGVLLLSRSLRATTIAAIWTGKEVVIAVDSKMLQLDRTTGKTEVDGTCKVLQRGNAVYVSAGLASGFGFNILKRIPQSDEFRFPGKVIPALKEAIRRDLEMIVPLLRKDDPADYARFRDGIPILTIFIGWPDGQGAALHVLRFFVTKEDTITPQDWFMGRGDNRTGPEFFYDTPRTGSYKNPDDWYSRDYATLVHSAVSANIAGDPTTNGAPIVVIEITSERTSWNHNQSGHCVEGGKSELQFLPSAKNKKP